MKNDSFILTCKELYSSGIHPYDIKVLDAPFYKRVTELGRKEIAEQGIKLFSKFLSENQFFVNLWVAIILLESEGQLQNISFSSKW